MKKILTHIRNYILRGLLALIPIALSFIAVYLIFTIIDQRVVRWADRYIGYSIPGLGLLLVLVFLFILGFVTSNVLGKQLLGLLENIINRIPIIKTTYQVGKQLAMTLSLPERQVFQQAVLVEFFNPGLWVIGFVTGTVVDRNKKDETLLKIFIPKTPNPTTGFFVMVKESQTRDPGWSVEEAMKAVISGGIIGTKEMK